MPRHHRRPPTLKQLGALLLASPPVLLILVDIGYPVINAVGLSLGYTGGMNSTIASVGTHTHSTTTWSPTLAAYRDVLGSHPFWVDLAVTLTVTLITTTVVVLLAWALALYLKLFPSPLARLLPTLAVIPMFIPGVIGAWAMLNFWAADGFVGSLITRLGGTAPQLGFSTALVIIAQVWASLPFSVLMITSGVAGVPEALIEAARDAGASTPRVIGSVIVPMVVMPTIIAATFTAIGVIGSFTVPYFTGPSSPVMLGVAMTNYFQSFGQPQQSVVMAIIVFALASGIAAVYIWSNWRSARENES